MIEKIKKLFSKSQNLKKEIKQLLPEYPVNVEAGAHIGHDTSEMAYIFKNATIHAFEPVPSIYYQLKQNTKKYKNVNTYPLALSYKNGIAKIHVSSGQSDGSSSLLMPKEHLKHHPKVIFDKILEIQTITLDNWALENNISSIDFLWLDMQGAELSMLKSSMIC